ncbi:hypothetical protein FOL47_007679 [Perkinsus chesapeaki]|uniref:Uncharacterized protein n=1 Tax=Perkinsus chesapeaki TaxID=330153 RepID=A0A7J6LIY3_PERCH|nr:hypothetical protein FOL47_007679 [Perkinsus chesapeaki]
MASVIMLFLHAVAMVLFSLQARAAPFRASFFPRARGDYYINDYISFQVDGTVELARTDAGGVRRRYKCGYTTKPTRTFIQVQITGSECDELVKYARGVLDNRALEPRLTLDKRYLTFYQGEETLTYQAIER